MTTKGDIFLIDMDTAQEIDGTFTLIVKFSKLDFEDLEAARAFLAAQIDKLAMRVHDVTGHA